MNNCEWNNHDRNEDSAACGDAAQDEAFEYTIEEPARPIAVQLHVYDNLGRLRCVQDLLEDGPRPDDGPRDVEERAEEEAAGGATSRDLAALACAVVLRLAASARPRPAGCRGRS